MRLLMSRTSRRVPLELWLEALEPRTLLSFNVLQAQSLSPPNPAHSLLVRFASGASLAASQQILSPLHATVDESFPNGPTVITLGQGVDSSAALGLLRSNPNVLYAEPDSTLHTADV